MVKRSVGPLRNSTGTLVDDEGETAGLLNIYFLFLNLPGNSQGNFQRLTAIYVRGEQGLLEEIQVGVEEVKKQREHIKG